MVNIPLTLAHYDNFGYYTDDEGYANCIPIGVSEPYPSDLGVINNFLKKYPHKNHTYIDVGAHIGTTCMPLSRIYKNVIGFEANNHNFQLLLKNLEYNKSKNITVHNIGLYNETCRCMILQHKAESSGCFFLVKNPNGNIECTTLDEYCKQNNIENVDYIKIDTEGSELYVLEGALQTIEKYKPLISIESNGLSNILYNISEKQMFDFFNKINYEQFEISSKSLNIFFSYKNT